MNQSMTVIFVPEQVITWVIVGLIAGLLAGLLIGGRGLGFVSSIVVGLLGALLGGFLFSLPGINIPAIFAGRITLAWADILVASIGTMIILLPFGGFYRSRRLTLIDVQTSLDLLFRETNFNIDYSKS